MRRGLSAVLSLLLLASCGDVPTIPGLSHDCPRAIAIDGSRAGGGPDPDAVVDPMAYGVDTTQLAPMCLREPDHPLCSGTRGRMHEASMAEVRATDAALRAEFKYVDDSYQWNGRTTCGACTDYALTMARLLARRGQSGGRMFLQLMFVPVDGSWYAHASLWVHTRDQGMVEAEVNDPPRRLDWSEGARECYVAMDGRRRFQALPGFEVEPTGCFPLN